MAPTTEAADFLESTKTKVVATPKTHCAALPLKDIVFDPEENYRWGSKEGMERDLDLQSTCNPDGSLTSYQQVKQSITLQGVRDAIEVVKRDDGYHIISGFTRTHIALELGLKTIPAYIYDSSLGEDEYHLLQLQENAKELHRDVNWVQEFESFWELCTRYIVRDIERKSVGKDKKGNPIPGAEPFMKIDEAMGYVERIIGKNGQTMKNRKHWFYYAPERIKDLAKKGFISCSCLQDFLLPDKKDKYSDEFVDEVLAYIGFDDAKPFNITPSQAKRAIRNVKIRGAQRVVDEDGNVIKTPSGKASAKIRQSAPVLRDIAVAYACVHLTNVGLSINSSEEEIDQLNDSFEGAMFVGLGIGAGDVHIPPVLEQVLGDRASDDEFILKQDQQHRRTAEIYSRSAWIQGFLHLALKAKGVRDVGLTTGMGWITKDDNRAKYYKAIATAAGDFDIATGKWPSLKSAVLKAWASLAGTY